MPLAVQDVDGRAELVDGVDDAGLSAEVAAPLAQLVERSKVDLQRVGDLAIRQELAVLRNAAYLSSWMCG